MREFEKAGIGKTIPARIFLDHNADAGYSRLSANVVSYVHWQRDANDLLIGSDSLTEQVRRFVVTGDRKYLDGYFEEVKAGEPPHISKNHPITADPSTASGRAWRRHMRSGCH